MDICYLIPGTGVGGGMIVILEHVNRLLRRGHNVFMLNVDRQNNLDWFPNNQVKIYSVFDEDYPREMDVLVATGWDTSYKALLLDLKAHRKVYFVQSDESRFYPEEMLERRLAWDSYFLPFEYVTEAKWIRDWLAKEFGQAALYAPNGLNHEFVHESAQPIAPRDPKRIRILIEGPICIEFKGADDAFHAVEDLDAEIWCVSSAGGLKSWYRCDRFFEAVPFRKMKDIYSSCDVLLKMSKVEGFFGPPLEMMACGGTAVTTRVTGYDEYIVDGQNALTVELGDYAGAREHLRRLMSDAALLIRLKQNGRATADKMNWEPTIDILEDFYEKPAPEGQCGFRSKMEESAAKTLAYSADKLFIGWRTNTIENVTFAVGSLQHKAEELEQALDEQRKLTRDAEATLQSVLNSKRYQLGNYIAEMPRMFRKKAPVA